MPTNIKAPRKWGMCLNNKCKNFKQPQEILHGEWECPECKKKMSPCPNPGGDKSNIKWGYVAGGVAAVALVAAGVVFVPKMLKGDNHADSKSSMENVETIAVSGVDTTDSLATGGVSKTDGDNTVETKDKSEADADVKVVTTKRQTTTSKTEVKKEQKSTGKSSGTLRLSYGKYTGETLNGYPHGNGRLTYTKSRVINRYDDKQRTADPGDYVSGVFVNGFFTVGAHYSSDGTKIGTINVGSPAGNVYDSK